MKFKMPGFDSREPKNKEEKLICELLKCLRETTFAFIRLNNLNASDKELFLVMRDSALAYSGEMLRSLSDIMADKKQIPEFLDECRDIFECYIQNLYKEKE